MGPQAGGQRNRTMRLMHVPHTWNRLAEIDWAGLTERLRRVALGLTRSRETADELVQQTLAALLAKAPQQATSLGYARRALVRQWLDTQRSLRRRAARLARAAAGQRGWYAPADAADEAEQAALARKAIERLPPLQRAVLTLRLVEELDYAAIAEIVDGTVESVRASLHLARRRVREALGSAVGESS